MRVQLLVRPLVIASLAAALLPAGATADGPPPTVVEEVQASYADGTLSISGLVDWGGQAPVVLGTDPAGDAPAGLNDRGLDITSVAAWVADGDVPVATFAWRLSQLDQAPPPEAMRYYWQFVVDGASFALQAKTSDFVSGGNLSGTPQGLANNVTSYADHTTRTGTLPQFRIRGNCETIAIISNCGHVAWASGEFDPARNEIRFHLPLDSAATPAIRPGKTVAPDASSTTGGIWASAQAAIDNTSTRDSATQTGSYTIPTRTASASVTRPDGTVTVVPLQVGADGVVTGTAAIPAPGPTGPVTITACFAGSCGQGSS